MRQELKTIVGGGDDFSGCRVSCGSGYYACCNDPDICNCFKNGTQHICNWGGEGAQTCATG